MDQLDAMRAFVRVAELESFTRCAEQTGIPKATLSAAIRRLEERMGTRLLLRTTRRVQLTTDGQLCYARCRELLADMEEFDGLFRQGGQISGQLRVDMPSRMARHLVIPALPDFLAQHPALQLMLSSTDRRVDLVREGFDCVVRVGALEPSSLGGQAPWSLSPDQLCQRRLPGSPRGAPHPWGSGGPPAGALWSRVWCRAGAQRARL